MVSCRYRPRFLALKELTSSGPRVSGAQAPLFGVPTEVIKPLVDVELPAGLKLNELRSASSW